MTPTNGLGGTDRPHAQKICCPWYLSGCADGNGLSIGEGEGDKVRGLGSRKKQMFSWVAWVGRSEALPVYFLEQTGFLQRRCMWKVSRGSIVLIRNKSPL